jgi:uncharacterized protein (TIGR02453 family)
MNVKPLLEFLKKLEKNNHKEWFDAHKKEYDALRKEWISFIQTVITGAATFDPDIAHLEAKNCIFRINRDVRFSKDKSPYKTNFGASMSKGGKKSEMCGYYIHLQPGECFIAGGAYAPMPEKLAAIRQEIDYNHEEFKKIVSSKSFREHFGSLSGEQLSRPPKGYEADNPAIGFLKHKSFLAYKKISDKEAMSDAFEKEILKIFRAVKPLNDFLNTAIDQ